MHRRKGLCYLFIAFTGFVHQGLYAQDGDRLANPALINGSDFGNIFQRYYKLGDYSSMLCLTSKISQKQFGEKHILEYYKLMDFGYSIKLKSANRAGDFWQLNYEGHIAATTIYMRMIVVLENDSIKLVLPTPCCNSKIFLYR